MPQVFRLLAGAHGSEPTPSRELCQAFLGIAEARRRKAIANYDYNLNGVFFKDLKLADPDV